MNDWAVLRRVTRLLLAATAALLLGGMLVWLARRPLFDIHRIELRGEGGLRHVSAASVRAALRGAGQVAGDADDAAVARPAVRPLRGNFFTLKLDDARRVFETLPWVAAVSVRRGWPDRLIVTLTEHRALGVWGDGRLLSDAGVLFTANPAEVDSEDDLPEFDGPERFAEPLARRYREFSAALAPLRTAIDGLEVSERASWTLHTRDDIVFELGRDEPPGSLPRRLDAVVASWPRVIARIAGRPARVDLRHANGFAVAGAGGARADEKS
jgi:cell division protein FtsQ